MEHHRLPAQGPTSTPQPGEEFSASDMGHHRDTLETNREFVPQSSEIQSLGIETTDRGQHLALLLPREARETDATRIDRGSKGMPEILMPDRETVTNLMRNRQIER